MVFFCEQKFELPKSTGLRGLGRVFRDVDICVFLFMVFVLGSCWGFIETFLFVYLKEDMAAPMYVLGLTITVGAVVSLPFIYMSDWLVEKVKSSSECFEQHHSQQPLSSDWSGQRVHRWSSDVRGPLHRLLLHHEPHDGVSIRSAGALHEQPDKSGMDQVRGHQGA